MRNIFSTVGRGLVRAIDYTPTMPPGVGAKMSAVLGWVAGIGAVIVVLGFILAGIMLILSNERGMGNDNIKKIGYVIVGAIVISAASALGSALV